MMELESSIPLSEARLLEKIRTLLYLENLKIEQVNSSETECPICSCNVESGVSTKVNILLVYHF